MNARPHSSRQRVDVMELTAFQNGNPETLLRDLLEKRKLEIAAKTPPFEAPEYPEAEWSDEQRKAKAAFQRQRRLFDKLHGIAEDARDYFNDHGESCLALGFPLLSMPAGMEGGGSRSRDGSRILAPVLLMPLALSVRRASRAGVTFECEESGADLIRPNAALLAWLEKQTGQNFSDLFADDEGSDPWREITEVLQRIAALAAFEVNFGQDSLLEPVPALDKLPKATCVLPSAVLGLFPLSNQALLRDTKWMVENETSLQRPLSTFLKPEALEPAKPETEQEESPVESENTSPQEGYGQQDAWLVTHADPCQTGAVQEARMADALVVHGPPGTGKSQTITNIIGDHLARGERVLFVCDKRTALDVVKYRLDAAGLGLFCGVVHDPTADRKDFYMGLREQLENLNDAPLPPDPTAELTAGASQIQQLRGELSQFREALHSVSPDAPASFHEMLGEWLDLTAQVTTPLPPDAEPVSLSEIESQRSRIEEILRRAAKVGYAGNPWRGHLQISTSELLALSSSALRDGLQKMVVTAREADAARVTDWVLLEATSPLETQATKLREAARHLQALAKVPAGWRAVLAGWSEAQVQEARGVDDLLASLQEQLGGTRLDPQALTVLRSSGIPSLAQVSQSLAALVEWRGWTNKWYGFLGGALAGKTKTAAVTAKKAAGFVGDNTLEDAERFYGALKTRLTVVETMRETFGFEFGKPVPSDAELSGALEGVRFGSALLHLVTGTPVAEFCRQALMKDTVAEAELDVLNRSALWAGKLSEAVSQLKATRLPAEAAIQQWCTEWISGASAEEKAGALLASEPHLEDMARLRDAFAGLPSSLILAMEHLAMAGATVEEAWKSLRSVALQSELERQIKMQPILTSVDGERVEAAFQTILHLSRRKASLVRDHIHRLWLNHQKSRLLASTGTQLNRLGSALRQRLYVRGKKALKLRQMLATGAEIENGDPIYDLCPVWMASPATVAQIFPRIALFDVIIFDEASQCRLEEALPVLMRGLRVVVAGDPKQLPPTRFFESALAESDDTDAESADELFVQQQSDAEDLLTAALNLNVRQAYLDVHYRSRNDDLISFSNHTYYGSRLQPIPGHPKNKALSAPITVHRAAGVYSERANLLEAEKVARLVAELLEDAAPPSIGIACFNLPQRDAINTALGALADAEPTFAKRLKEAKEREGESSFEGLFVKNLENVQGDERDVIVISTTFGPDPNGKFRRGFGALSQREGGRRLNVLITRARVAIHVITSIPEQEYRHSDSSGEHAVPNGRLQLYAYLRYAEQLEEAYRAYHDRLEKLKPEETAESQIFESATPSRLAQALGRRFRNDLAVGNKVHWGNEGFMVDVACVHPTLPADVTIGVLADFTRFHKTPDPLSWDLFRCEILKAQGWELHRVWSPALFRRYEGTMNRLSQAHQAKAEEYLPTGDLSSEAGQRGSL